MGGDLLAGTNFLDALKIFEKDEETHGIILIGELGGATELEAAAWILDYNRRATNPKPIAALIAGFQVSSRTDTSTRAMGHVSVPNGAKKLTDRTNRQGHSQLPHVPLCVKRFHTWRRPASQL